MEVGLCWAQGYTPVGIETAAKAGWIPMDIAVDGFEEDAHGLYLKMDKGMKEWRLEAGLDKAGLEAMAVRNAAQGLLPVAESRSACGSPMRILALITDAAEVKKILRHLIKIGKPPPGLDPDSLN